jgi:nicotinamide mononucleotide transporter
MYHFARNSLPMQAALNAYYVVMAVYGFWHWSREQGEAPRHLASWPLKAHLLAWAGIAALSGISAHWLAAGSAWPWLDSAVAWSSVLATWLMARVKLENWLYWIATDAVLIFLSIVQDLPAFAILYFGYLCIAVFGFLTWLKALRMQPAPA